MKIRNNTDDFLFEYKKNFKFFEILNRKLFSLNNYAMLCNHFLCVNCLKELTHFPCDDNKIISEIKEPNAFRFSIMHNILKLFYKSFTENHNGEYGSIFTSSFFNNSFKNKTNNKAKKKCKSEIKKIKNKKKFLILEDDDECDRYDNKKGNLYFLIDKKNDNIKDIANIWNMEYKRYVIESKINENNNLIVLDSDDDDEEEIVIINEEKKCGDYDVDYKNNKEVEYYMNVSNQEKKIEIIYNKNIDENYEKINKINKDKKEYSNNAEGYHDKEEEKEKINNEEIIIINENSEEEEKDNYNEDNNNEKEEYNHEKVEGEKYLIIKKTKENIKIINNNIINQSINRNNNKLNNNEEEEYCDKISESSAAEPAVPQKNFIGKKRKKIGI